MGGGYLLIDKEELSLDEGPRAFEHSMGKQRRCWQNPQEGEKPREVGLWKLREEKSFKMEGVVHCFR